MRHGRSPPVSETIAGCSDCPPLAGVLDSRCQGDDSKPGGLTPLKNNTCCMFSSGPCLLTSIYSGEGALSAAVWLHFNCAIFLLFVLSLPFFRKPRNRSFREYGSKGVPRPLCGKSMSRVITSLLFITDLVYEVRSPRFLRFVVLDNDVKMYPFSR